MARAVERGGWGALRRYAGRHKRLLAVIGLLAPLVTLYVLVAVGQRPRPLIREVAAETTVQLFDEATLGLFGPPELIEHYDEFRANLYLVQMRMCGGKAHTTGNPRRGAVLTEHTYFGVYNFTLLVGGRTLRPEYDAAIHERPRPPEAELRRGECRAAWLVFRLPEPLGDQPAALRYTYDDEDIVTWRLPSRPVMSPISRPYPPTTGTWNDTGSAAQPRDDLQRTPPPPPHHDRVDPAPESSGRPCSSRA